MRWETRKFLLVAHPQRAYAEQQSIIHKARERALERFRFEKDVEKREILFHDLVRDMSGLLTSLMACFLLLRSEHLPPKSHTYVEMGMQGAKRQQMMIQEILEVFAAEMGASQIDRFDLAQAPDVAMCARDVIGALLPCATLKNIRLQLALSLHPEQGWKVVGEPSRLQHILFNLVENALRHAPPDSTVTVDLRLDGGASDLCRGGHRPRCAMAARRNPLPGIRAGQRTRRQSRFWPIFLPHHRRTLGGTIGYAP